MKRFYIGFAKFVLMPVATLLLYGAMIAVCIFLTVAISRSSDTSHPSEEDGTEPIYTEPFVVYGRQDDATPTLPVSFYAEDGRV